jgi:hypothetical protein
MDKELKELEQEISLVDDEADNSLLRESPEALTIRILVVIAKLLLRKVRNG